jgi:hypothetical protein
MKLVGHRPQEVELGSDPRPLDRENKHRLRILVHRQKIHPTNGCVLYILRDDGRITQEQCDAGDKYWTLTRDFQRLMDTDPEELRPEARELAYRRIEVRKRRYHEALDCLGMVRRHVDDVVFNEIWPVGERGHLAVCQGLELLNIFFATGKNKRRTK